MTPSLLFVPSARKSGKAYSILPSGGSGDLTFTRASTAIETNGSNLLSSVATGVPRLDYTDSSCPKLLLEPARTNLCVKSDPNSAEGPSSGVTYSAYSWPIGLLSNATIFGDNSVLRYRYFGSVTAGTTYTMSCYVLMDDGSKPNIGMTSTQGDFRFIVGNVQSTGTPQYEQIGGTNVWRVWVTDVAANSSANNGLIKDTTQSSKGFKVSGFQIEAGSYPSSYIPTTSATATRVVETATLTDLKTKGLIGATEGSIGGAFSSESIARDGSTFNLYLGFSEFFALRRTSASSQRLVFTTSGGILTYVSIQDFNKWLFSWNASGWYLSVNGAIVASGAEVFTFPNSDLSLNGAGGKWELNNLYTYTTKLTEDEAIQKTGFTSYEIMANELGYTID